MADARILLGIPFLYHVEGHVCESLDRPCDPRAPAPNRVVKKFVGGASIPDNFNKLWAFALNNRASGLTHFGMHHVDVIPRDPFHFDRMLSILEGSGADLLSVVLPIKTPHGLTSTALYDPDRHETRRLTTAEVWSLPSDTFDAWKAGFPSCALFPSTGLWLCDFRRPWVEEFADLGGFATRTKIVREADGSFGTRLLHEDWHFGRLLYRLGVKVAVTRAVACSHVGPHGFDNTHAWGSAPRDGVESLSWLDD